MSGRRGAVRLATWAVLVVALLTVETGWLVGLREGHVRGVIAWLTHGGPSACAVLLLGIIALLLTTPPHALRLSRHTSESLIAIASLLLQGASMRPPSLDDPKAFGSRAAFAVAVVGYVAIAFRRLRARGLSAWWVVPFAWNPIVVAPSPQRWVTEQPAPVAAMLLIELLSAVASVHGRGPNGRATPNQKT